MSAESRIESLERRVKADPASAAFASLAEEYRRAGRLGEAIETCRVGLERHPAYASARVTLARALHDQGELDEALAEFETVLGFAPENLAAIRGLADIHRERGDRADTVRYLEQALALAPLDVELRDAIALEEARMIAEPIDRPSEPAEPPDLQDLPGIPEPSEVAEAAEPAELPEPPELTVLMGGAGSAVPLEVQPEEPQEQEPAAFEEERPGEPAAFPEPSEAEVPALAETADWFDEAEPDLHIVVPEGQEPADEPFAFTAQPFAQIVPPEPESAEDARTPDADERHDRLRRQEEALEHFLAEILKERGRRAG